MKIKEEFKNMLFKNNKEYIINKKTILLFMKKVESVTKKFQEKQDEDDVKFERSIRGTDLKAEDLDICAKAVTLDIANHLNHADYVQHLFDDYKNGRIKHRILYDTQDKVDKYKIEMAKLFHSLSVKLRMASMFGFGEVESPITIVDTKKLPTLEEAKKMDKDRFKRIMKKAEDKRGRIDNTTIKTVKKELNQINK